MELVAPVAVPSQDIKDNIGRVGYHVLPTGIDQQRASALKQLLIEAIAAEDRWHGTMDRPDHSMVLACPVHSTAFAEVLAEDTIWRAVSEVLGEGAIVYAYTSSSMPPRSQNYSSRIHNDCPRDLGSTPTNLGLTLPLDDFTEENGATFYVPKSHRRSVAPSDAEFFAGAQRLIAPAGTALLFDARLWHAGGPNTTNSWRHALTVNFCRPWMKQRLDLPRLLGEGYRNALSSKAAQRLGFDAQVPASYSEYYQPAHRRSYRQSVE